MDLGPHIEAIRADLSTLSGADEAAQGTAERLGRALEPSLQLRMQDVLSEAALELREQLPAGDLEVRVAGRDARLTFVGPTPTEAEAPLEDEEGGTARLTLRMPEALKNRVEEAAAREGLSVNAWLVRAVNRGLEARRIEIQVGRTKAGRRITGFAQS